MKTRFIKLVRWMDGLKRSRHSLYILIVLDLFLAIGSNIADWPWLSSVPWYVLPFTPICSLYTVLIALWFILYARRRPIPAWLTSFIFMAITSYGIMSFLYFPLYMSWAGVGIRNIGNMIWVAVYAFQSIIIMSELKRLPVWQYLLIFSYFAFKDFSDLYLGSFWDFLIEDYPKNLITFFSISMPLIQILFGSLIIILPGRIGHLRSTEALPRR